MFPIVTVIIPTANRPHYLPRAVKSALSGMQPNEVEVIVIPNGLDESWKESLKPYRDNPSVRVMQQIPEANANIARNAGLAAARGNIVRFLDDDDYLIPEGAVKQYNLMKTSGVDVICGAINAVNTNGEILRTFKPPAYDDFCEAITSPRGFCLTHAYVYRKACLDGVTWNPAIKNRQDVYWLFDLCKSKEIKWIHTDGIVGVWQHHWGLRISTEQNIDNSNRRTARTLLRLFNTFKKNNRLSEGRSKSIAEGLWSCVHAAFIFNSQYWTRIAKVARRIDPQSKPIQPIYNWPMIRLIDPLVVQWILWPKKLFSHFRRGWALKHKSESFW
ncbi:MAG: glycosyltransferase family 2 protein [Desulfotomaculaceae bacterium]|nr:glycosyltransferase family 2 protein [Desulfotomaculaceae bacterium]